MRAKIAETKAWAERFLLHVEDCVLPLSNVDDDVIDAILDNRDSNPFDGGWVKLDALLQEARKGLDDATAADLKAHSDKLRFDTYSIAASNSHHPELAIYVSDDVGLIFDCLALGVRDEFLSSLINAYSKGKIPGNGMEMTSALPKDIDWL